MPGIRTTRSARAITAALFAVLAVVFATTTPARAATTYTPTGGPSVSFAGTSISFTDIPAAQTFSCTAVNMSGSLVSSGTSRAYGANAANLSTLASAGCANPLCGATTVTMVGTWGFTITGDPVGGAWPARFTNVKMQFNCVGCAFTVQGVINGKFTTTNQRFTPVTGPSGLLVATSPAPTGFMCTTLDIQPGDDIAVGGYWTNNPPAGSSPITITNP